METHVEVTKAKELIDQAQDILIVTHENPTDDSIGSTLALYLGLASLGKKVTVACPDPMTVGLSNFIGVNKVTQELGKKNFVIALDYIDGSIEKVSYNIEGDKFNLVIEPRPGFEPFSADKVHYGHTGAAADVIIAVDTIHLGGLKKLYEAEKEFYTGKSIVNIDRHSNNARYGQVNIIDPHASSTSELVTQLLSVLGVRLTEDIATNLLNSLYSATDNFQNPNLTAFAFEVAAACVKAGGKRFGKVKPAEELPQVEAAASAGETPVPETAAGPAQPLPQPKPKPVGKPGEAPQEWLKPKIFKSSNLS